MAEIDVLNAIAALDARLAAAAPPSATNYFTNPSFETESATAGVAEGWNVHGDSCIGEPAWSLFPAIVGDGQQSQHIAYYARAGDAGAYIYGDIATDLDTFANGDPCTISGSIKGAVVGATVTAYCNFVNNAGTQKGTNHSEVVTVTASTTRFSVTHVADSAEVQRVKLQFFIDGIDNGDSVDILLDDFQLEKSLVATPYFDGASRLCQWADTPNASVSTRGSLTDRLESLARGVAEDRTTLSGIASVIGSSAVHIGADSYTIEPASDISAYAAGHYQSFPSAVACDDGTILCAYRDATSHFFDGKIRLMRCTYGSWGESWALYDNDSSTDQWQGCTLAKRSSDGRIFLYTRKYILDEPPATQCEMWQSYSDDNGATWSAHTEMPTPLDGFEFPETFGEHANKFVELGGGVLLMTAFGYRAGEGTEWSVACMESTDGITWTHRSWIGGGDAAQYSLDEASLIKLANGNLLCIMRCENDMLMRQSSSTDDGLTWTVPALIGGTGTYGHAPVVYSLPGGALLLSFRGGNETLRLMYSLDGGENWSTPEVTAMYSHLINGAYSDIAADPSGNLHLIYYHDDSRAMPWISERLLRPGRIDAAITSRSTYASGISSAASAASADAKLDDVLLKTNTLGSHPVTVTSPVAASGTITVYSGDDYASEDSRAITVAVADPTHALGLDGAVVKLKATQATWTAASVASTTDGYTVTFEATAAQTAAVTRAQHYELEATLANGHVVTLAKGTLVAVKDIPAGAAP